MSDVPTETEPSWLARVLPAGFRSSFAWRLAAEFGRRADHANIGFMAAGVAFFGIFSLFPAIAAIIALFGLLADPIVVVEQIALIERFLPDVAYDIIAGQTARLLAARDDALGLATLVSVGIALFSARAAVAALIVCLNRIYEVRNRTGLRHLMVAFTITITLIGVAIIALLSVVVAPIVLAYLALPPEAIWVAEGIRWAITLTVLVAALSLIYRWGPNLKGRRPDFWNWGAAVAIVVWALTSIAFSAYLANFANYNEIYGSLGAVIGMMLWLYISAAVVLAGAALNAALSHLRAQEKRGSVEAKNIA